MMKTNTNSRGFTLIELLVVIAIIGILASVVLASLNSARDKGADAAIKSSVNNSRAQAELFYDDNSNAYTGLCADPTVVNIQTSVDDAGGAFDCDASATAYRMISPLVSDNTVYYCVDSTGVAQEGAAGAATDTVCP